MDREREAVIREVRDELLQIQREMLELKLNTGITSWDIAIWIIGGILAIIGLIAAPFSAGASLIATVLGLLLILVDAVKKIRDNAQNPEDRKRAQELINRTKALHQKLETLLDQ